MPSVIQLEYIVAVDKHRHFGKAAEACHVTQPTLSMQIQKVEAEIGYPVFDRFKKPVVPTPNGNRFIEQAKVLLREHRKLLDLSKQQSGRVQGELKVGVIPTLAPYIIPLFLETFSTQFPDLDLRIDELKTDVILQKLREDAIDVGLLATPLHENGMTERVLFYEPFHLYVSKRHKLNERRRIKEDDLDAADMWLLQDGHCLRNQVVRICSLKNDKGVFPNVHFEGGNIDTLRNIIRKSRGYTLVPSLFVETLLEQERRDFVREFEKPTPVREISMVYRRDQWKLDALAALEQGIRRGLPDSLKHVDARKAEVVKVR